VLIEWGQKEKKTILFLTEKEESKDTTINYQCKLNIDEKQLLKVRDVSKKKAEEKAAKRAFNILRISG
jgi:ribonuclease-3